MITLIRRPKYRELVKYFSEWEDINLQYFFCKFRDYAYDCQPDCGIRRFLVKLGNDSEGFNYISTCLVL